MADRVMGHDSNYRSNFLSLIMKKKIKKYLFLERIARYFLAFIPFSLRKLDKEFWKYLELLNKHEKQSIEEIQQYQFLELKKLLDIAYNHSQFYKQKYDAALFHPDDILSLDDMHKIPILTKDEIRQFSHEMIDNRVHRNQLKKSVTSGTTGKSLELFSDRITLSKEWASICYQWKRIGYKPGDGRIEFRGFMNDKYDFIFLPDEKVLRINIIRMSNKNIAILLKKIDQTGYKFIHGYPSAIYKFAKILESGQLTYTPNAIMMASEVLYDWQMETIDTIFNCPKIIHYGQAEKVALGAWTAERKYSFIPSYGILEHDPITHGLIATSLINNVMPLIRYQLTDTALHFVQTPLKKEMTLFPVIENIDGREEDFTYDDKKNLIPPAVVTFPFKELNFIEAAKIIQYDINNFELILETEYQSNNSNLQDEIQKLINNFKKLYGNQANFKITLTNKIPLGSNGKFRWIECKI